jgi:hypothetical protein
LFGFMPCLLAAQLHSQHKQVMTHPPRPNEPLQQPQRHQLLPQS